MESHIIFRPANFNIILTVWRVKVVSTLYTEINITREIYTIYGKSQKLLKANSACNWVKEVKQNDLCTQSTHIHDYHITVAKVEEIRESLQMQESEETTIH